MAGPTYYLNVEKGSDDYDGCSLQTPWRSLNRLNSLKLEPGTRIFLEGGQVFDGSINLDLNSSGTPTQPIVVTSLGNRQARIRAGSGSGIVIHQAKFIHISQLEIEGCGRKNGNHGRGIELRDTEGIKIENVKVFGFRRGGIWTSGDQDTEILHVYVVDNGSAGIEVCGRDGYLSKNVRIAYCVAENNAGDPENKDNHSGNGIVVGKLQKGIIEYCLAFNNGWDMPRKGNGPVGIWGWECDGLTIRYCISHSNKSPGYDGGGFDLDGGCKNCIIEYNLSYCNEGPGYLLCQYPGASPWYNNVVRFNISYYDGLKNTDAGIHIWQGDKEISNALIYNNIIVNPKHAITTTHDVLGIVYRDNIFISGREIAKGFFKHSQFRNNWYWYLKNRREDTPFLTDGDQSYSDFPTWVQSTGQELEEGQLVGRFSDPQVILPKDIHELPVDPVHLNSMHLFRYGPDQHSLFSSP